MTPGQQVLADLLAGRLETCHGARDAAFGGTVPRENCAASQNRPAGGPTVFVVLSGFRMEQFLRGALAFACGLDAEAGRDWLGAYTRTVFLTGNPANLAGRFSFRHLSEDGRTAWTAPVPAASARGLSRLLRAVGGTGVLDWRGPVTVTVPGTTQAVAAAAGPRLVATPDRFDLWVRSGTSLKEFLVDVHHTLSEAVLTGVLRSGDELRMHHSPTLTGPPNGCAKPAYARVLPVVGGEDPERLPDYRLHTWMDRVAA